MKEKIIENISKPEVLEKLYRDNAENFSKSFQDISQEYDSELMKFWKIRLAPEVVPVKKDFEKKDLRAVIFLSILGGILVKIPAILMLADIGSFFERNIALIIFNGLILYTMWNHKPLNRKSILWYVAVVLFLAFYLNVLPYYKSDSIKLTFIYAALFLWCLFGFAYIKFDPKKTKKLIGFIRFNGELTIMTGLIIIAGFLFSMITIQLFSALNLHIEVFMVSNILLIGGVSAPIISFYLIRIYPGYSGDTDPLFRRY